MTIERTSTCSGASRTNPGGPDSPAPLWLTHCGTWPGPPVPDHPPRRGIGCRGSPPSSGRRRTPIPAADPSTSHLILGGSPIRTHPEGGATHEPPPPPGTRTPSWTWSAPTRRCSLAATFTRAAPTTFRPGQTGSRASEHRQRQRDRWCLLERPRADSLGPARSGTGAQRSCGALGRVSRHSGVAQPKRQGQPAVEVMEREVRRPAGLAYLS